jgi:hypothetical protein
MACLGVVFGSKVFLIVLEKNIVVLYTRKCLAS